MGDDGQSEGCDGSSNEDLYNPNHTPNNKDKKRDESSACGESDSSESSNLVPECTFKGPRVTSPKSSYSSGVLPKVHNTRNGVTEGTTKSVNRKKIECHNNVNATIKELEILTGLYLRTGFCQLTGKRGCWENDTRCPMVTDNLLASLACFMAALPPLM